jgi:hypothetical protein
MTDLPLGYLRRGWGVVPIPRGQKKPVMPGWQNFGAMAEDVPRLFGNGENVAVRLGPRSGELVDIDLDCLEALTLADAYLPVTTAEFGRDSDNQDGNPGSRCWHDCRSVTVAQGGLRMNRTGFPGGSDP